MASESLVPRPAKSMSGDVERRELHMVAVATAVHCKARAVRTTVAHGGEHARQHATELRLKRFVLQKKTDNSAHFTSRR